MGGFLLLINGRGGDASPAAGNAPIALRIGIFIITIANVFFKCYNLIATQSYILTLFRETTLVKGVSLFTHSLNKVRLCRNNEGNTFSVRSSWAHFFIWGNYEGNVFGTEK